MRLIDADDFGNRMYHEAFEKDTDMQKWDSGCWIRYKLFENVLREQPTAQPERDIPIKPVETTDTAWGIPHRQAVCPKCDYYLGHVVFLGDYKGKKVTYCETCGQAIDWEEGEGRN